ncbi:hypothetical protein CY34DRAFT_785894 [Suillus luteus UH-Slu-Lm8-n1]|uniref:Pheromone receptor n=1 Tax=Suillus luteus UH-Slu-Lm8-n1 TaxID=930992 RepID=A0A0D0BSH9_9AGAM|nr:hypothetical protein CY34DRAFT_785894 [Suillus luteus UH-Slu-Lm8-n1]
MTLIGMPRDAAVTMSLTLECILYGISIFMFLGTICALTHNRHMHDIDRPSLVVAVLLLILSTAHVVVNIFRAEDGLVKHRDIFPGGPTAFFADVSQSTYLIKSALYVMQTLLADGIIYRCYVVWQSARVIILPCILWCSVAVTGVHAVYSCSQSSRSIFAAELARWIEVFLVSTIATNLLSSGLLAYRIWLVERSASTMRTQETSLMPILRVLVDSAVLYTAVLFPALICFLFSNTGEVVVVDMAMPIMSIAFYMVLVRIAINRNRRFTTFPKSTTSETQQGDSQQYPMSPLQFHASKITHSNGHLVYGSGKGQSSTDFE